jgi:hypothetical protein
MQRAHETAWMTSPPSLMEAPHCASCGGAFELRGYGAALFCRDCREMSDEFYRKDLYCDLGGGD